MKSIRKSAAAVSRVCTLALVFATALAAAPAPARAQAAGAAQGAMAVGAGGDVLNEVGIAPLPQGMTYEEYQDATRRLSVGLLFAAIPGGMHFYANERTKGWILLGTVVGGVVAIGAGAAIIASGSKKDCDFSNGDVEVNGDCFERTPSRDRVGTDGTTLTARDFDLNEVARERHVRPGGPLLVGVGAIAVVGGYLYSIINGIYTIEEKRDRVRYKYGMELGGGKSAALVPSVDANGNGGLALAVAF